MIYNLLNNITIIFFYISSQIPSTMSSIPVPTLPSRSRWIYGGVGILHFGIAAAGFERYGGRLRLGTPLTTAFGLGIGSLLLASAVGGRDHVYQGLRRLNL